MQDFRKLKVWEKSHSLTLEVYRTTQNFPKYELYGLTSQMRKASSSIPANIAEGCAKNSDAGFARFLNIAIGSASELQYHLLLSRDLDFINNDDYEMLYKRTTEIKQMLTNLMKKLRADS